MKNNFKSKIFLGLCIGIFVFLLIALVFVYMSESKGTSIADDEALFNTDFCNGHCTDNIRKKAIKTTFTCQMCHQSLTHPNTHTPIYCSTCASMVGKCQYCGKFFSVYSR